MNGSSFVFGYGSLVNAATLGSGDVTPAKVRGWGRTWKRTRLRKVAFLTAIRDDAAEIEGVIAPVEGGDWTALDAREYAYDRHIVDDIAHGIGGALNVSIYATKPEHHSDGSEDHPILLSYLDTVIQGYLRCYDAAGATRFFDTTSGWDTPVFDDRAAPIYPRAQSLEPGERAFVDDALRRLEVRRITSL